MYVTRSLSPSDFSPPPVMPSTTVTPRPALPPVPAAPIAAPANDPRLASILAALKAARPRLDSNDAALVAATWRQISLQVGYLIGYVESRSQAIPSGGTLPTSGDPRAALDELIRSLETASEPTRVAVLFFWAGVAAGLLLSRAF